MPMTNQPDVSLLSDSSSDFSSQITSNKNIDFGEVFKKHTRVVSLSSRDKEHLLRQHWRPSPGFQFSTTVINNKNRKFQHEWLQKYSWLVYSPFEDGAYCKYCLLFAKSTENLGKFAKTTCKNWNKACDQIKKHSLLQYHKDAMANREQFLTIMDKPEQSIASEIDQKNAENIAANRQVLTSLFRIVEVCGRQGLALRGNCDDGILQSENRSNFNALLNLCINAGDETLRKHLDTCDKKATYISKSTQNRLIEVLGDQIRNKILAEIIAAKQFTVLADEVTDSSNWEQLSIILRFVDGSLKVREEFLAFVQCRDTTGETLYNKIVECLGLWGLDFNVRGQGYDGAANMAGKFKGVQARFQARNNKALYFHCASRSSSLCIVKACGLPAVKNMMGALRELSLFFSNSRKRQRKLEDTIEASQPDTTKTKLVDLCRTRWVEKHEALEVYTFLFLVVHDCLGQMCEDSDNWDSETLTKATGFLHTLSSSVFLVAFVVVRNCLRYLKPLTVKLQKRTKDVVDAYREIKEVSNCMSSIRRDVDTAFVAWFGEVSKMANALTTDVVVSRQASRQTLRDNQPAATSEEYFKISIAIPFLEHLSTELDSRFKNADLAVDGLCLVPSTLIDNQDGFMQVREGVKTLAMLWESDLPDNANLGAEYQRWVCKWRSAAENATAFIPSTASEALKHCDRDFYPNLFIMRKNLCTLPVTTAESERSNSPFCNLKNYLRSTMGQQRLNALALLKVHRDVDIDFKEAVNCFARRYNSQMVLVPRNLVQQD